MQPLKIQLFSKEDTDGQVFYIGKLKFPGKITAGKGAAFLVFIDDNIQELHIAMSTAPELYQPFKYYQTAKKRTSRSKHSNIAIELRTQLEKLDENENREPKEFFIGKLDVNCEIDATEGVVFLVFTADVGEEELQISVPGSKNSNKNHKIRLRSEKG